MRSWLYKKRTELKLTQKEISKLAGISRSAYSNIEAGKRDPSVAVAKKISDVIGVNWVIFFEDDNFNMKRNSSSA